MHTQARTFPGLDYVKVTALSADKAGIGASVYVLIRSVASVFCPSKTMAVLVGYCFTPHCFQ